MKLEFLTFDFDKFSTEMQNLKTKKHFDYLVTIVGEVAASRCWQKSWMAKV